MLRNLFRLRGMTPTGHWHLYCYQTAEMRVPRTANTAYFDASALRIGAAAALALVALIYIGSRGLNDFDWALATYAVASVFAAFAVVYRYAVWAQRPPTRMYLRRGWEVFLRRRADRRRNRPVLNVFLISRNLAVLGKLLLDNFVLQKFINRRSIERWIMHACLSWGGMLAFAVTFPLVFGWVHFETPATDATIYRVLVFGFPVDEFAVASLRGQLFFNLLNISAVLMLIGLALSFKLRMSDRGELAIQTFADDVFPLALLFTVSVTGLMLTLSARLLAGYGFAFIGLAHAASVIGLLLYLPFGKLFHIVQRPLSLGVSFYREAGAAGQRTYCWRCGGDFASAGHVDDLKEILDELGFDYRFSTPGGEVHYQDVCPGCRRRLLALNQGAALSR